MSILDPTASLTLDSSLFGAMQDEAMVSTDDIKLVAAYTSGLFAKQDKNNEIRDAITPIAYKVRFGKDLSLLAIDEFIILYS